MPRALGPRATDEFSPRRQLIAPRRLRNLPPRRSVLKKFRKGLGGRAMKSFSSSSFASDHAEVLDLALAAVRKHPQALFSDFQWFLYEGHDTVFYTASRPSRSTRSRSPI